MGAIVAVVNKKGEDAAEAAVVMLEMLRHKCEAFGIASPNNVRIEKSPETLKNCEVKSPIIVGWAFSKIFALDKPQPVTLENAMLVFEGRIYSAEVENSVESLVKTLGQNREEQLKNLIKKAVGDFAFAVAERERLIVGRDAVGVRPLYYGENGDLVALASERKALWKIGIGKACSFPPGNMALIDAHGFKFKPVRTLVYSKAKHVTMEKAVEKLKNLLEQSVKERVSGLREVAVAFSGGLDSSLIAFLAKRLRVNIHLIHVSLKNQLETEHAEKAAEALELPIHTCLYEERQVAETLPKVVWLVEEPDPVKAGIGTALYWTAEIAADLGFRVLLAGQGADELFGGYKKYVSHYTLYGEEKTHKKMFDDITKMYEDNFERDSKICGFHNVELRLPFATYEIDKFAVELPVTLKIGLDGEQRKVVLRKLGEKVGLPQFIVERQKKAVQYATGISHVIGKLAKKENLSQKAYVQKIFETVFKWKVNNE
ncbi:MAG: asparagine synthetase B [Candidatus Bathyarchaeia archaeon]